MDSEKKHCIDCGELKARIQKGKFGRGLLMKRWVDETGRQWVGHRCPQCHVIKMKNHMKKKREEQNAEKSSSND